VDELSLVRQFVLMASIVIGSGMVVLGSFVSSEIENSVVHNTAATTGLYVNSLNATYLQELETESALSHEAITGLDASFTDSDLGKQILSVKIWLPNGHVVYSSRRDLIATNFSANANVHRALKGEVTAQFASANDPDVAVPGLNVPIFKIYVPIHGTHSNRVVAAAEFLTSGSTLKAELGAARLQSWIAVGGVGLLQILLLYGIVARGNKTIESQRAVLLDARRASVETNELFLRRVGADLHDGPAQLISLALLRLDALRPTPAAGHSKSDEFEKIRAVLQDGLGEIRHLSAGLAPPHLDALPLYQVLELAVRQHEQRTGTVVKATIGVVPDCLSSLHKVCIYRFVQEGLNNAFRHAAGEGQTVQAIGSGDQLSIEVADSGPGFSSSNMRSGDGLGLAGLRDRVESLGGEFSLETQLGLGTRLRASFQVACSGAKDA